jgi:hypothetical protein
MLITLLLLTITVVCAAFIFDTDTNRNSDNLLSNFKPNEEKVLANVCRGFLAVGVLLAEPQAVYMPRQCLMAVFKIQWPTLEQRDSPLFLRREGLHVAVTLFLLGIGLVIALATDDLSGTFGLIGGVAGILITVVLPCGAWLKLASRHDWPRFQQIAVLCTVFIVLGAFATVTSIWDTFAPLIPGAAQNNTGHNGTAHNHTGTPTAHA